MKIMRPNYYEPHNYIHSSDAAWFKAVKPYLIFSLLTVFFVYAVAGAANWGRNHCHHQQIKNHVKHKR